MKHLNEWVDHQPTMISFEDFRTKVKYLFLQLRPHVEAFLQELEPEMRLALSSQIRRLNMMDVLNKIYTTVFGKRESLSQWLFKSMGMAVVGEVAELLNKELFSRISATLQSDKTMQQLHSIPGVWLCVCCIILTFLVP